MSLAGIRTAIRENSAEVQQLRADLAAATAKAETFELTAIKGQNFEETIHLAVADEPCRHGDVAEFVGRTKGVSGTRKGDEVVVLNPEDTGGTRGAIVLEDKDHKLALRQALDEVAGAMKNHQAQAGIAVFSRQAKAPVPDQFVTFGDKAIVVFDKAGLDDPTLRSVQVAYLLLAYLWARSVVQRNLGHESETIDFAEVQAALTEVRLALRPATTIRKHHGGARREIELADMALNDVMDAVDRALKRLEQILGM